MKCRYKMIQMTRWPIIIDSQQIWPENPGKSFYCLQIVLIESPLYPINPPLYPHFWRWCHYLVDIIYIFIILLQIYIYIHTYIYIYTDKYHDSLYTNDHFAVTMSNCIIRTYFYLWYWYHLARIIWYWSFDLNMCSFTSLIQ
jgi:hypothetical protein